MVDYPTEYLMLKCLRIILVPLLYIIGLYKLFIYVISYFVSDVKKNKTTKKTIVHMRNEIGGKLSGTGQRSWYWSPN